MEPTECEWNSLQERVLPVTFTDDAVERALELGWRSCSRKGADTVIRRRRRKFSKTAYWKSHRTLNL